MTSARLPRPLTAARGRRGFTLVEMLVAVAIFAIASALAYGGLSALTRARSGLEAENARLGKLQFAIGLVERDLRSAVVRGVRDANGAPLPALLGARERIELSRQGHGNQLALPRAEIERVGYRLEDGILRRERHLVLDRTPGSRPVVDDLLDQVEALEWRYLASDGRELALWPPPRDAVQALPRAVVLRLQLADYGEIRRVLELPEEALP